MKCLRCWCWCCIVGLLTLMLLGGCRVPATVTPVPTAGSGTNEPAAPTGSAPLAPGKPTPAPQAGATAAPAPTALAEPGIVATWRLDDLPTPGRWPVDLVSLGQQIWVANRDTNNLSVIAEGQVVQVLPLPQQPWAMTADQQRQRVYVACSNGLQGSIQVLSSQGLLASWPTERKVGALAMVDDRLWIAVEGAEQIVVLNAETGQQLQQFSIAKGSWVRRLIPRPAHDQVLALVADALWIMDANSGALLKSVPLENPEFIAPSPDGTRLYLGGMFFPPKSGAMRYVQALALSDFRLGERLELPDALTWLAVSPDGAQLAATLGDAGIWLLDQQLVSIHKMASDGWAERCTFGANGQLCVTIADASTVALIDPLRGEQTALIALDGNSYSDIAVDSVNGRVYVACANQDQVLVLDPQGRRQATWPTGRWPVSLATWPGEGSLAVVSMVDHELALYDQAGKVQQRFDTQENPRGVMIDPLRQRVYAGGLVADLQAQSTRTLSTKVYTDLQVTPVKTLLDTRRERLYGIVPNGIPGSNGGFVLKLLDGPEGSSGPDEIGWRSVVDAIYDENQDVFYVAWTHMGSNGLVVAEAETGRAKFAITLDAVVTAMALNPATRHLWLATGPYLEAQGTNLSRRLRVYDSASIATAYDIPLQAVVHDMAVDPRLSRLYMVSNDSGSVYVAQDMVSRGPSIVPGPPTVTPFATSVSEPTALVPTLAPPPTPVQNALGAVFPTPGVSEPDCSIPPHPELASALELVAPLGNAGCPLADGITINLALQPFEGGALLWRADTGLIYALLEGGSVWTLQDAWSEGMPDTSCEVVSPSADRWQPIRGFGQLWCQQPELRQQLGWGLSPEQGLTGVVQAYEQGDLLHLENGENLFLGNAGAWQRLAP